MPRRVRLPRTIGFAFAALAGSAALSRHGAGMGLWLLLLLNGFAWPPLAFWLSSRSATPREAEHRNLLCDCSFAAAWVPVLSFNPLPTAVLLSMTALDSLAVGGTPLLLRGLVAQALGVAVSSLAWGLQFDPATPLATVLACLPMITLYPLTLAWTMYRLSLRLSDKKREFERSERLHRATLDALDAGIALFDADDRLVLCSGRFRDQFAGMSDLLQPGLTYESMLREAAARGLVPEAAGREAAWVDDRLRERARPQGALQRQAPDGRWLRVVDQRLPDGSVLSFFTDITDLVEREQQLRRLNAERDAYARELRAANAQLEQLSHTDALTGLANRRLFDRRLQQECRRAQRHGLELSLLMIDVDHFKRFNDRHGHPGGDACLRRIAAVLGRCVQRSSDLVARYGGEEFALLLPHADAEAAALLAQRCLQAIDEEAIEHGDSPVAPHVTLSIGVASLRAPQLATLLGAADEALYRAKQRGRHRAEFASGADATQAA